MSNESLRRCPVCDGELDDAARNRMGLRTGELLNSLCPGRNGPSDIDHIIHNGQQSPERVVILEYKNGQPTLPEGQRILFNALKGKWREVDGDRELWIGYRVLSLHDPNAEGQLREIVSRVWPTAA